MTSSSSAFLSPSVLSTTTFKPSLSLTKHTLSNNPLHQHPRTTPVVTRRPRPALHVIKCSTANVNDGRFLRPQPFDRSLSNEVQRSKPQKVYSATDLQPVRILGRTWYLSAKLMLILTPFLWGGYTVSVRLLYTLPWALSPAIFNSIRLGLASLIVLPGLIAKRRTYINAHLDLNKKDRKKWWQQTEVRGGIEIGIWTFLVNILQIAGIKYSSASRASFLAQLNSIIVPFAAYAFGMEKSIGLPVYLASVLSIFGVALFSLDDFSSPFTFLGEGVLLISALAGAAFVLRCKTHSSHQEPTIVIGMKIISQFLFSILFILPMIFKTFSPVLFNWPLMKLTFLSLFNGATPWLILINILLVVYNGVCISWLSSIFHVGGQNSASASEAAVIFASTPIWSAALAIPLGERFGLRGFLGASFIVLATLLASMKRRENENNIQRVPQIGPLNRNQLKQMET